MVICGYLRRILHRILQILTDQVSMIPEPDALYHVQ